MSTTLNTHEPTWLADVRADVATWPPLTAEQLGTVVRAFAGAPPGATATITPSGGTTSAESKSRTGAAV